MWPRLVHGLLYVVGEMCVGHRAWRMRLGGHDVHELRVVGLHLSARTVRSAGVVLVGRRRGRHGWRAGDRWWRQWRVRSVELRGVLRRRSVLPRGVRRRMWLARNRVHEVWRFAVLCLSESGRRKRAGGPMRDDGRRWRRRVDVLGGDVPDGVLRRERCLPTRRHQQRVWNRRGGVLVVRRIRHVLERRVRRRARRRRGRWRSGLLRSDVRRLL